MSSRSSSPHPTTIVPPYHHHHFATWEYNPARNNAGSSGGFKALPSSRGKRRQKKEEEREVLRIMDESYLPRRPRGGDNGHDLETEGELHDIDHRPFPPINNMMRSPQRTTTMGNDDISCLDVQHGLRKSRTAPAAYWETFNLPPPPFHSHCMSQEPEEAEVGLGLGGAKLEYEHGREREHRHPLSTSRRNTTPTYYYLDNTQNAINSGGGGKGTGEGPSIESQGGRCVLKKKRRGNNEGEDRDEGKRRGVIHEGDDNKEARERGEGTTMIVGPKDKLHQTWVTTRLGVHLKVIRTQRWLKEHM